METTFNALSTEEQTQIEIPAISPQESLASLLSAVRQARHELDASLSAIPVHPYERLLSEYVGDETCITFEEIPCPEDFNPQTALQTLSCISDNIYSHVECQMQKLTACGPDDNLDNIGNCFSFLSGDVFVEDRERTTNHLKFLEMVKSIPDEEIDKNPIELAQKVVHQYLKMYR